MPKSRIIIVGPGGSGKTYMGKKFSDKGFKRCVTCTSRPKRETEIEGIDYYFVKEDFFDQKEDFYEIDQFNGWFYGTLKKDFIDSDLVIMTARGIKSLLPEDRKNSVVIYVDPPKEIIKARLSMRNDADTYERRMLTDYIDFEDFEDFDIHITNEDF